MMASKQMPDEPVLLLTAFGQTNEDPIINHLKSQTSEIPNSFCSGDSDFYKHLGMSERQDITSNPKLTIEKIAKAAYVKYPDRAIVIAIDEIQESDRFNNNWSTLNLTPYPLVRFVLVFNPKSSSHPLDLPDSNDFLHAILEIRYRSTVSIINLARFLMRKLGYEKWDDEVANDTTGTLPILFDLGEVTSQKKLASAVAMCEAKLGGHWASYYTLGRTTLSTNYKAVRETVA